MLGMSPYFIYASGAVAVIMLVWNTIEVGRNDAANIVNAVFGARVMRRKKAVFWAGLAVIVGAWASSPVMQTARKGIFDPTALSKHGPIETIESEEIRDEALKESMQYALVVYVSIYLVNTVLLYSFSAFGMPVSTTACLVFGLLGGAVAVGGPDAVHWAKSRDVILGIICSIFASGIASFMIQRAFRGAIGTDCRDLKRLRLHGPWVSGALLTGLLFFILMKGMKNVAFVKALREMTVELGYPVILLALWSGLTGLTWLLMHFGGEKIQKNLFSGLAILGMLATAIAFGQNDLANCASPGVSSYMILKHGEIHSQVDVSSLLLVGCGILLFFGMMSKNAQRVTRAEVNTGSQGDVVRLYAPEWCLKLGKVLSPPQPHPQDALAPETPIEPGHKVQHYDALRAAVITSVSSSVIAFASGMGLPVSTTYVAFAAVVSTGWADRIFERGDAHLKIGRTIWVVFCWFFSALLAAVATAVCAKAISVTFTLGIALLIGVNLVIRAAMKRRADIQEERLQEEADARKQNLMDDAIVPDDDENM